MAPALGYRVREASRVLRQLADRYGPLSTPSGESAVTSVDQSEALNAATRIALGVSDLRALATWS
jgi:hypothetical protein